MCKGQCLTNFEGVEGWGFFVSKRNFPVLSIFMVNVEAVKSFAVISSQKNPQQLNKTSPIPFEENLLKTQKARELCLGKRRAE